MQILHRCSDFVHVHLGSLELAMIGLKTLNVTRKQNSWHRDTKEMEVLASTLAGAIRGGNPILQAVTEAKQYTPRLQKMLTYVVTETSRGQELRHALEEEGERRRMPELILFGRLMAVAEEQGASAAAFDRLENTLCSRRELLVQRSGQLAGALLILPITGLLPMVAYLELVLTPDEQPFLQSLAGRILGAWVIGGAVFSMQTFGNVLGMKE